MSFGLRYINRCGVRLAAFTCISAGLTHLKSEINNYERLSCLNKN